MVTPPNSQAKDASPAKCAADVKSLCATDSFAQKYAMVYTFAPGKSGLTLPACPTAPVGPAMTVKNLVHSISVYTLNGCACHRTAGCHGSTSNITDPDADIAAFLATRGGTFSTTRFA